MPGPQRNTSMARVVALESLPYESFASIDPQQPLPSFELASTQSLSPPDGTGDDIRKNSISSHCSVKPVSDASPQQDAQPRLRPDSGPFHPHPATEVVGGLEGLRSKFEFMTSAANDLQVQHTEVKSVSHREAMARLETRHNAKFTAFQRQNNLPILDPFDSDDSTPRFRGCDAR